MNKIFPVFLFLFLAIKATAQEAWPSPEVGQMYHHAQEYIALSNYKEAVTICKQAILLAPGKFILFKELGTAYYLSGDYNNAAKTFLPLTEKPEADEQCYQMLAASQVAQANTKDATATLKQGLARFPASGLLYHEAGKVYYQEHKPEKALNAWLDGIQKAPAYPPDYYEAARSYMGSGQVIWALLYGEVYLSIAQDTTGFAGLKKDIFAGYKTMFDNIAPGDAAGYQNAGKQPVANSFSEAIQQVYTGLTPVVSDGLTTETLTMVRTRFLIDWFAKYAAKYPYSLFSYQDYLVRNGLFDIYNEWLFGKAESIAEYDAWNTFHPGELKLFLEKQTAHQLTPAATDFYNARDMHRLFKKKK